MVPSHITEVCTYCGRGSVECISLYEDHLSVSIH